MPRQLNDRMVEMMNRKISLLWTVPLVLGFSAAWAQDAEEELAPMLPDPAVGEPAELPDAADNGLTTARDKTAGLPGEATIRLMDDDDDLVTNEVELPELPPKANFGQRVADDARDGGVNGREIADEARDLADEAQDAAEGRGRAEDLPVDVPGRPDLPDHVPTPPRP